MAGTIGYIKLRQYLIKTGVAVVGSLALTYLPNTLGVNLAKQYLHGTLPYCKAISSEPETAALLDEVIKDINAAQAKPVKKDGIEFIQTNDIFPVSNHKGSSSTGSIITFPIGTRFNAAEVFHYHCPDAASLEMAEFCLLSTAAKKFLFARQIYYVEDSYVLFRCLLGVVLVLIGSALHYLLNSALNSLKELKLQMKMIETKGKEKELFFQQFDAKARRHRAYSFVLFSLGVIQLYQKIRNFYNWELERSADEKVAKLGPEYVQGGLEYYEKIVKTAKFTQKHHKTEYFDNEGNIIQSKYQILHKHVPHTHHLAYFAMLASEDKPQAKTDN